MNNPYLGEIALVSCNFAPRGWALCNGQLLPINQNQALFSLLGTTYGGNGQTTFALPDLRGRSALHFGARAGLASRALGERAGTEAHTLNANELPTHTHAVSVVNAPGTQTAPGGNLPAAHRGGYAESGDSAMHSGAVTNVGGSQPHENRQPFLALNYCISLGGVFPSPTGTGTPDAFVGEIRIFAFNFAPSQWASCNGQLLPLSQNTPLFSLLGTTYGGDGQSNFALPDIQCSFPMHPGQGPGLSNRDLGGSGGTDAVALQDGQIPAHTHALMGGNGAPQQSSAGNAPGASPAKAFHPGPATATSNPTQLTPSGGSQPHNNMPPFTTLHFCIAVQGIFPPRS